MLKKPASIVLATFRGSAHRDELHGYRSYRRGFSVRQNLFKRGTAHTKYGLYLLASSLPPALLGARRDSVRQGWGGEKSGLFEHPTRVHRCVLA